MNKFLLCVFVILAIGMAELPSTFGCHPDYINGLPTTSTTSQRPPKGTSTTSQRPPKNGKGNPKGVAVAPLGSRGVYGSVHGRNVHAGGNVFELEMEGFSICNTDGTEGLTFDEINACRVNNNFTQYVDTYLIMKFLEFQIRLGKFVIYSWPTASDFDAADANEDGNLTKAEFVQYIS